MRIRRNFHWRGPSPPRSMRSKRCRQKACRIPSPTPLPGASVASFASLVPREEHWLPASYGIRETALAAFSFSTTHSVESEMIISNSQRNSEYANNWRCLTVQPVLGQVCELRAAENSHALFAQMPAIGKVRVTFGTARWGPNACRAARLACEQTPECRRAYPLADRPVTARPLVFTGTRGRSMARVSTSYLAIADMTCLRLGMCSFCDCAEIQSDTHEGIRLLPGNLKL